MYIIAKAGGKTTEYLTESEKELQKLSMSGYLSYLDEKKLPRSSETLEAYLIEESKHTPAVITGSLGLKFHKDFGLDYKNNGKQIYLDMISGKFPSTKEDFLKAYPNDEHLLRKDNRLIKQGKNGTSTKGYSMVLAMPRSLSMAYSIETDEKQNEIKDAINNADYKMKKEMETLLRPSNKGYFTQEEADKRFKESGGKFIVPDNKIIIESETKAMFIDFYHYENRGTKGKGIESHLHKHIELMPSAEFKLKTGETKFFSLDNREVLQHQKELTSNFNILLVNELETIGINCEPDKTIGNQFAFKVAGITREQELETCSRRKELMESSSLTDDRVFIQELKSQQAEFTEMNRKSSATKKDDLNANQIHELIKKRTLGALEDGGKDYRNSKNYIRKFSPVNTKNITNSNEMMLSGEMSISNIKASIGNELRFSKKYNDLKTIKEDVNSIYEKLINSHDLIAKENGKIVSIDICNAEENCIHLASKLIEKGLTSKSKPTDIDTLEKFKSNAIKFKKPLNVGQVQACELIAKNKSISLIEGDAGSGKSSSVLKFSNIHFKNNNLEVFGMATQTKTGKALAEIGIEEKNCSSIAKFLTKFKDVKTGEWIPEKVKSFKNSAIIVDEGGMVDGKNYNDLLYLVEQSDTNKIVFCGDKKQLSSIGASSIFTHLTDFLPPENQSRLWENMRQKNEVAKSIAESFKEQKAGIAINIMRSNGLLNVANDKQSLISKIADDYIKCDRTKCALAYTNEDVNNLNQEIRSRLIIQQNDPINPRFNDTNKIYISSQKAISVNMKGSKDRLDLLLAVNDRIVFTAPTKLENKQEIFNSDQGTIKSFSQKKDGLYMNVDVDGKVHSINTDKHKDFNLAFCLTSYSSQGITTEESFVLCDKTMNNNMAYVDFSRHEHKTQCYIIDSDINQFIVKANEQFKKPSTLGDGNVMNALQARKRIEIEKTNEQLNVNEFNQGSSSIVDSVKPPTSAEERAIAFIKCQNAKHQSDDLPDDIKAQLIQRNNKDVNIKDIQSIKEIPNIKNLNSLKSKQIEVPIEKPLASPLAESFAKDLQDELNNKFKPKQKGLTQSQGI